MLGFGCGRLVGILGQPYPKTLNKSNPQLKGKIHDGSDHLGSCCARVFWHQLDTNPSRYLCDIEQFPHLDRRSWSWSDQKPSIDISVFYEGIAVALDRTAHPFEQASMGTNPRERPGHNFFSRTQQRQCRIISLDPESPQIDWEKIQAETYGKEDCASQNLEITADKVGD
jgi:hypothetical protein